jgi:hypothetical protein
MGKHGFMNLSERELHVLKGRVAYIDVQEGCPVQCFTCGFDAPRYRGSMSRSDFLFLSESIANVREKYDIDVLLPKRQGWYIEPFHSSDPVYYHSREGSIEWTIYDILSTLYEHHERRIAITTAGWKGGNNYMQRAMEQFVHDRKLNKNVWLTYSVKTVMPFVIKDYLSIVEQKGDPTPADSSRAITTLLEGDYAKRLEGNMTTLRGIQAFFWIQCVHASDLPDLPEKYKEPSLQNLFCDETVRGFFYACRKRALAGKRQRLWSTDDTYFDGFGRAVQNGISLDEHGRILLDHVDSVLHATRAAPIKKIPRFYSGTPNIYSRITPDGHMQLYLGPFAFLGSVTLTPEYFHARENLMRRMKNVKAPQLTKCECQLLAGLCNRPLLE